MHPKFSLILDFDSTLIKTESIEDLSKIVLDDKSQKTELLKKISDITNKAMSGEMSFEDSLHQRLSLLSVNKNHINQLSLQVSKNFDNSFIRNLDFFESFIDDIYIVSGGFKKVIKYAFKSISNKYWNIFANDLEFIGNNMIGVDKINPLSRNFGKAELIKSMNLYGDIIVVGDGYTDYEIKKLNLAKYFLCYTKHIKRSKVIKHSDLVCDDFNQVVKFLDKRYF